jgi:hypothetical protein
LNTLKVWVMKILGISTEPHNYYDEETASYWDKPVLRVWYDKSEPEWVLWSEALSHWLPVLNAIGIEVTSSPNRQNSDIQAGIYIDYTGWTEESRMGWSDIENYSNSFERKSCRITLNKKKRGKSKRKKVAALIHEWGHCLGIEKHFTSSLR